MSTRAALRYAKAILNLAAENKSEEAVNKDMQLIVSTISESDELETALESPVIKVEDKVSALTAIFGDKINSYSLGLIKLLGENKRLGLLDDVAKQYSIIYDFSKSKEIAIVTSAVALTSDLEKIIIAKVKELTGKESAIENIIDPKILGGFILRIGDIQYDASIANKLKGLERSFDESHFEAKI